MIFLKFFQFFSKKFFLKKIRLWKKSILIQFNILLFIIMISKTLSSGKKIHFNPFYILLFKILK